MNKARDAKPHIVIIGAGFGGLWAAKHLKQAEARVTLIDRNNYHLFVPLLYQVASAGLTPADISEPIRHVLRKQKNVSIMMDEVVKIDPDTSSVFSKTQTLFCNVNDF